MRFWGAGRWRPAGAGHLNLASAGHDHDSVALSAPAADAIYGVMSESLVDLGLQIVHEVRGPMRLWDFSRRLGNRLGMPPVSLSELSDAVKTTLSTIDSPRLRVLAPGSRTGSSGTGAGYVYDAADPDSWPVRSSR